MPCVKMRKARRARGAAAILAELKYVCSKINWTKNEKRALGFYFLRACANERQIKETYVLILLSKKLRITLLSASIFCECVA